MQSIKQLSSRRMIGLMLLSTQLAACTTWRVQQLAPARLMTERHPNSVRITRADQTRLVIAQPTIVGDTLIGAADVTRLGAGKPLHVAVDDIRLIETRQVDAGRTIALFLGVPAVAIATFMLLCTGECLER